MRNSSPKSGAQGRPQLGLGACLAGHAVRYDGSSNPASADILEMCSQFDIKTFCPEVGIGLSVPRPPIHLVGPADSVRVLDVASHQNDYTAELTHFAQYVLACSPMLCGYVLVTGSPSCGYQGVKRFSATGELTACDQRGIFARALGTCDPLLPCADDEQLVQHGTRNAFFVRATVYHHWKLLVQRGPTQREISDFYRQHHRSLETPCQKSHKNLQRLIDTFQAAVDREAAARNFITTLMNALPRIHIRTD